MMESPGYWGEGGLQDEVCCFREATGVRGQIIGALKLINESTSPNLTGVQRPEMNVIKPNLETFICVQ